jgi:hypothetical protein
MWLSNSPWCLVWDAYCNVLNTQPVATKLATGMVGTFLGDMLAQSMQVGGWLLLALLLLLAISLHCCLGFGVVVAMLM